MTTTETNHELDFIDHRLQKHIVGHSEITVLPIAGKEQMAEFKLTRQGSVQIRAANELVIASTTHTAYAMLCKRVK